MNKPNTTLDTYIEKLVSTAPPLTTNQRAVLRALLAPITPRRGTHRSSGNKRHTCLPNLNHTGWGCATCAA